MSITFNNKMKKVTCFLRTQATLHGKSDILLILLTALVLRLIFLVGLGSGDSLEVADLALQMIADAKIAAARLLTSPSFQLLQNEIGKILSSYGADFILIFSPISFFYLIGKASELTSILYPLISSLLTIALVYLIGRKHMDESSALIAALLFSILPTNIFSATQPISTQPILFISALTIFIVSPPFTFHRRTNPFVITVILFLGFFVNIWIGLVIGLIVLNSVLKSHKIKNPFNTNFLLTVSVIPFLFGINWLANFQPLYTHLRTEPGFEILIPLILIASTVNAIIKKTEFSWLYAWISAALFALLVSFEWTAQDASTLNALILFLLIPLVMIVGHYLANGLGKGRNRIHLLGLSILLLLAAWFGVRGQEQLISTFSGVSNISIYSAFYVIEILRGFVFIALIASPIVLFNLSLRNRKAFNIALLVGITLSFIPGSWKIVEEEIARNTAIRETYENLQEISGEIPIYILEDRQILTHLKTLLVFNQLQDALGSIDVVGSNELSNLRSGYILFWEGALKEIPNDWLRLETLGLIRGPRLSLLRVMDPQEAENEMNLADVALMTSQTTDNYYRLYSAAVNAGALCTAYQAWNQFQALSMERIVSIAVDTESAKECFAVVNSLDMTTELTDAKFPGYTGQSDIKRIKAEEGLDVVRINRQYSFYSDPRIFDFKIELNTDAVYLYSITIRSREPVKTFYWRMEEMEYYLEENSYPAWTEISILLATPGLENNKMISLSPVIFSHYGNVFIKDFHFVPIFSNE